jgi:hypothetical protein
VVEGHAEGGEVTFVAGLDVGDEGFRGDPGLFRASMIGVPWVSSAQTNQALPPLIRRARTQMSAWM